MPELSTYATPDDTDVVVIGAGINGLAIAREAATRGLSVVLIDQDDIAARTSAISTRLIHGGLKYLERLEVPLVFESIRERDILLDTAPHLVRPYPMLIPFSRTASRPGWLLSCGLVLHDVLSLGKRLPLNRIVLGRRLRREWPSIAAGGVRWGGLFQDAHVPVTERFAIELAIDAARNGARIVTHSPVLSVIRGHDGIRGVVYRDRATGAERRLTARIVVNAAGPWVDDVLDFVGPHDRRIGPTKGSHLVVDAFPGAPDTCIFFESPEDQRPMFVLPWWDGKYMIGTTDLPYDGGLAEIIADDDEIRYLLSAANELIPEACLTPDAVLWSYSGVRPLPYVGEVTNPASVSRDSEIVVHDDHDRGLLTVIGGKYTTHRALGEEAVHRIEEALSLPRARSRTRTRRFPGAPMLPTDQFETAFVRRSGLPEATARRLARVYGALAEHVERLAASTPDLASVIDEGTGAIAAEVVYAVVEEGALTLEDVLVRRTVIALGSDVGLSCAPVAARVLVEHAGWDPARADEEIARYRESVRRFAPKALRVAATAGDVA
ncbi:glycerol-3-phosphate dehydrogenase/oxidase [Microbacter sp. GSS18]|nr:glycerol-3-phosphate dehydrogenase/oxidase [Microbacter sp. GSS18]